MRKTFVMAFVVLLAVLAVSCDIGSVAEAEKPEYTADGRKLVNLKVKIGGASRALSDTLAKGAANYIEVIFKNGTDYYRADGLRDQVLSLRLPADNYTSANSILLVGKKESKSGGSDFYTLLAVGTPATGGNLTSLPPGTNTAEITFSVTSLTADLYAGGTPTFTITNDFSTGEHIAFNGKTTDGTFHDGLTTCFQVPTSMTTTPIRAELEISGFGSTTTSSFATKGTNTVTFTEVGNTLTGDDITVASANISFDITSSVGTIGFSFQTGTNKANYVITFDIPVVGLAASGTGLSDAITWHICGGTDLAPSNYQSATGSGKEGVALLVTSSPHKLVNISVNPNW